ncbi:MAG: h16 [Myxococcales bacterium]|nr:h16 [Myxococcales bacterium]
MWPRDEENGAGGDWFTPSDTEALVDFWRVYEENFTEVLTALRGAAAKHPAFRYLLERSPSELAAVDADLLGRQKRGLAGDWGPYNETFRAYAVRHVSHNVPFRICLEALGALSDALVRHLVGAYAQEPPRLRAVLDVARRYDRRLIGIVADEFIRAREAALRASERDLATTLDCIGDGMIATDGDEKIVRFNPVAAQLTGWSVEEALHRSVHDVYRVRDARTTSELTARDGRVRPITQVRSSIRDSDGPARGVVIVFRDRTEEHEAARALQASEARKAAKLAAALDAILTIDHTGAIVEFNPAAELVFGYARADAIGRPFEALVPPALRARHRASFQRYLETGEWDLIGQRVEVVLVRADGSEFPAEVAVVRIALPGPALITGYIRDIGEAKRAREELQRRQSELRALAASLQTAREQERVHVSREIHDELGQRLTAMKMDIGWIERRIAVGDRGSDVVERLHAMSELVDSTVDTVRRLATQLRPGILDDLGLTAAIEWQAREFQSRSGIVVEVRCEGEQPISGETATTLFRVFQELLTNVARHAGATRVEVRLTAGADQVSLEVHDDGRGISALQAATPTSIGLVGIRERMALLGGHFSIVGRAGGGTTVRVEAPRPGPAEGAR